MRLRHRVRRAGRERGAAAVEFALISLPLLCLIAAIVSFGFAFNGKVTLTQTARAAARQAAICGSSCTSIAGVKNAAHNAAPQLDTTKMTVQFQYCTTAVSPTCNTGYCPTGATQATYNQQVVISYYPYSFFKAVVGKSLSITLVGRASLPCGG